MGISRHFESWNINGHVLEYDDETHTYICDGQIVPSVTQMLGKRYANEYANVSQAYLNEASRKGTAMHSAIEAYETTGEEDDSQELRNYKFLKKHYGWTNKENEVPIIYEEDGVILFAGRLDQIMEIDGQLGINDFKRVSSPNKEKIALQLNMYKLGYEQSYNKKINFLRFTQLREDVRKFYKVPINEEATKNFLKGADDGQ